MSTNKNLKEVKMWVSMNYCEWLTEEDTHIRHTCDIHTLCLSTGSINCFTPFPRTQILQIGIMDSYLYSERKL